MFMHSETWTVAKEEHRRFYYVVLQKNMLKINWADTTDG